MIRRAASDGGLLELTAEEHRVFNAARRGLMRRLATND